MEVTELWFVGDDCIEANFCADGDEDDEKEDGDDLGDGGIEKGDEGEACNRFGDADRLAGEFDDDDDGGGPSP